MTTNNQSELKKLQDGLRKGNFLTVVGCLTKPLQLPPQILGDVIDFMSKGEIDTLSKGTINSVLYNQNLLDKDIQKIISEKSQKIVLFFKPQKSTLDFNVCDFILADRKKPLDEKEKILFFFKKINLSPSWDKLMEALMFMPYEHMHILLPLGMPPNQLLDKNPVLHYLSSLYKVKIKINEANFDPENIQKKKNNFLKQENYFLKLIKSFLDSGWNINVQNDIGNTFLHVGSLNEIKFLCNNQANPNIPNNEEYLPLVAHLKSQEKDGILIAEILLDFMKKFPLPSQEIMNHNFRAIEKKIKKKDGNEIKCEEIYFKLKTLEENNSGYKLKIL